MIEYGSGTGNSNYRSRGFIFNDFPTANGDNAFPIKYNYVRLFEKVYRKVGPDISIATNEKSKQIQCYQGHEITYIN